MADIDMKQNYVTVTLRRLLERSNVMSISVCVSVCLRAYLRNYMSDRHQVFCVLPITVARSSYGGVAIRYVLPVSWMTSCLHIIARKRRLDSLRKQEVVLKW